MMKKLVLTLLVSIMPFYGVAKAELENYVIDTKGGHAAIQFKTKHLGYSWLVGRFNTFEGEFSIDDFDDNANKIVVDIDVASIDSNHAERDKHLRSADFLDTKEFPKARFESTKIKSTAKGYLVTGNLTLRNVTKEISFDAKQIGAGSDPWGGYRRGFEGETSFKYADFGYKGGKWNFMPKNVYLTLTIEGIRKE